jgi:hypothetical protein
MFRQLSDLPPPRILGGVAEGVEEEGGDDGAGLGAGGVGAAPDLRRSVQQPHNPPLLVQRRKGDFERLELSGPKCGLAHPSCCAVLEKAPSVKVPKERVNIAGFGMSLVNPYSGHMIGKGRFQSV